MFFKSSLEVITITISPEIIAFLNELNAEFAIDGIYQ